MTPKITAVIPHHSNPEMLGRALDSILSQTRPVEQIVVVDDATPDPDLRSRAREIALSKPGVEFVGLDENGGPGSARNFGWDRATGDWIAFCDADDTWHPDKIEHQSQLLYGKVILVGAEMVTFDREEGWPELRGKSKRSRITLDRMALGNPFSTSSVVIRREIPFRFTPGERYCEDYELWTRAVAGGEAWLLREPLCARYKAAFGEGGLSGSMVRMAEGERKILRKLSLDGTFSRRQTVKAHVVLIPRTVRRFLLAAARKTASAGRSTATA